MIRRILSTVAIAAALIAGSAVPASAAVPTVNHVFMVVLENENADQTFGPGTQIPYLAQTLRSQGAFVPNYYGIGHQSLTNYVAMVSGQSPNPQTQSDCQFYTEFVPGLATSDGQYIGQGCVYPPGVGTVATQLEGAGYSWKGYMQDMANSAPAQPSTCRHPSLNSRDGTQTATATDQYAARHNPFVYFHGIIDLPTCQAHDVDLSQLVPDLASASTTPNYAFISPDLCNDGHDTPCADGQPGGMTQANTFLQDLVPKILASPAYQDRGLLIVTFDEAEVDASTATGDSSACCNEQSGPNTPAAGGLNGGPGGGRVGAVMLSPCIRPSTETQEAYNHYSLLRSVEDNFGLTHLGYAGQDGLRPIGEDILDNPTCGQTTTTGKQKKPKQH
jgi:phosphatidylinositol-3-phosphatase